MQKLHSKAVTWTTSFTASADTRLLSLDVASRQAHTSQAPAAGVLQKPMELSPAAPGWKIPAG